jgi:lysophospholipase L1-like esterase
MTDNTQNCVGKNGATWDHHHEGHSGYLAINIANSNMSVWLQSNVPDIVMFMLGTNDVVQQSKPTTDITAAFTKIITLIRGKNPNVKIIVSRSIYAKNIIILTDMFQIDTVIPCSIDNAQITALNAAIPAWATAQNTTSSPIWIANTATGFPVSDLRDGVHPNAAGDAIIAAALTPVLEMVINIALKNTTTKATEFKA